MRTEAILWDGYTKIKGFLEIGKKELTFEFIDFNHSSLSLQILISEIETLKYYRLFSQEINGIMMISKNGEENIFVVDRAYRLYTTINELLEAS